MGLLNKLQGVIKKMLGKNEAKNAFDTNVIASDEMDAAIIMWSNIIAGRPYWKDKDDDVRSISFGKFIASDTAKKICLDIDINVDGSARADYLQTVIDAFKKVLRDKVEDACGLGGIMFKPNGAEGKSCIDYVQASDFIVTATNSNGDILGAIFPDRITIGDKYYTRLEWQRFEGDKYVISNKAFVSSRKDTLGKEIPMTAVTAWESIQPEVSLDNVTDTLFAYYKLPYNNTIDYDSPLGVSVFSNAIEELKDLDIAWSRKSGETNDSKHITMIGPSAIRTSKRDGVKLPRFIKSLDLGGGGSVDEPVHEHVATMLTEQRIRDINSILSMISTKCGFSQGQFCLDGKTGMITATQIESDDRETIETIKDMRDALKDTIEHLIYAIGVYADLYDYSPVGEVNTSYAFGDLTYSYDEDRARHWQYVQAGKYPLYRYYMKFEGMSEEEAKALVAEANEVQSGLF